MAVSLRRVFAAGVVFLLLAYYQFVYNVFNLEHNLGFFSRLWSALWGIIFSVLAAMAFDMSRMSPASEAHTWLSAITQYSFIVVSMCMGQFAKRRLDQDSIRTKEVQDEMLRNILKKRSQTEWGKNHNFASISTREEYVKKQALTTYPDYKDSIDRVMKGEVGILLPEKPFYFGVTSSTSSGFSKVLPIDLAAFKSIVYTLMAYMGTVLPKFPPIRSLGRSIRLFIMPRFRYTEAGIVMGPMSGMPRTFYVDLYLRTTTTPLEAMDISNEQQMLYLHLLFALKDKHASKIETGFSSMVQTFGLCLEEKWPQLVEDIRKGSITPDLNIDEGIRWKLINEYMKPDPMRADEIEREIKKGFDGIFKRLWPSLSVIVAATSGTFAMYAERLLRSYARGCTIYSPVYGSTEAMVGVNLDPNRKAGDERYTMMPTVAFFEFIPIEHIGEEQPKTLFIDQVKAGEKYELVASTLCALYRFRIGDVIEVVDFMNRLPIICFKYRTGQLLSVHGEKTSEDAFYQAMINTVKQWSTVTLKDYSCAESVLDEQGNRDASTHVAPYYIVFIELVGGDDVKLTEKQKAMLDDNLQLETYPYASFRRKDAIGPMKVNIVTPGTFEAFRDYIIHHSGASINQLKVPRALRRPDYIEFMKGRIAP
ncbi:PREDICTED: probable indole-3-acetic acid-amido synthetase GH3.9 [Priapulus caudatus]|uniref:Probable indole-3-acetic acid-amido synthetase GH3.9 n=1 Tax=Priapulus caudatus TaxID=37621 RepID=A0ABM1EBU7_PRICU|nr:PREDICTED: probable indole-3-acetic acid-amido synthetase GH3.9 [Priapulus caudatus]